MRFFALHICFLFLLGACSSGDVKKKINEAGDAAGQVAGEFASGVSNGVEKAFEVKVLPTSSLTNQGISLGKTQVSSDSAGNDNLLVIYMIFGQDFKGPVMARAFDSKGLEMGRCKLEISGKKDEAQYIEFHFDKRTDIDNDTKLTLE
jgi:hypothetical protein